MTIIRKSIAVATFSLILSAIPLSAQADTGYPQSPKCLAYEAATSQSLADAHWMIQNGCQYPGASTPAPVGNVNENVNALYSACTYERWYPSPVACGGKRWTVSIKVECEQAKLYSTAWWSADKVCQSIVNKHHSKIAAKTSSKVSMYTVRRGDTLWRIALHQYGHGKQYTRIIRLNHLRSTRITVGQKLRVA